MSLQRKVLITGITGQDGSYLAEFLLNKGYEVHGMVRRSSNSDFSRIDHIRNLIEIHYSDLTDQGSMNRLIDQVRPHEIYNLAAQSFVHASFDHPVSTAEMTGIGVTRILEAIRLVDKNIKFYQASSSEMFGKVHETPQNEQTYFHPRSPYGVAKLYGHWITVNYRESYDMYCVSGILYNHESPRRGLEFVTRKISNAVARIKLGKQNELLLGNLDAKRDWGHARDYVEAMWLMLQNDEPDDFVIATGKMYSVRDFLNVAFGYVGLDYSDYVKIDNNMFRPAEVDILLGDPSKANAILGWKNRTTFEDLVIEMVESDLKLEINKN